MDSQIPTPSPAFNVIALVASAGGLMAFNAILSGLPAGFPAAVIVLQHLEPGRASLLPAILQGRCDLPVRQARRGDRLRPGAVFVAPPDDHLLVDRDGVLSLAHTERVHYSRPSADSLLGSVARGFGRRAIAVVLTGFGSDGSDGIRAIKEMGGTVIAQDRPTSQTFGMPGSAILTGCVDAVLPLDAIAPALVDIVNASAQAGAP